MKMAEPSTSESSPDADRDFDPSADMLVNDFDDERTMEEEEAMESSEDAQNELDDLQKEGDMPIEDLLSMYGYGDGTQADNTQSSSSEEILSNQDLTLDKDEIARDLLQMDDENKDMAVNDLLDTVDNSAPTSRLLRSAVLHHQSESESESENGEYIPEEDDDWKKTIQVGYDYQAVIPDGLCRYDGAPAYENDDKLLWDPTKVTDPDVEVYLRNCQQPLSNCTPGVHSIPSGCHVRDDEQALYLLLQCGHNIEEAMRRRRMQAVLPSDTMTLWSEEECRSFENGLRTYGKDFHMIQQNKVRTRSVGELVQFYYLWKKTERHDVFANKTRIEKKKYSLHPGTTDYMDRFLDEQENPSPHRDRSSSPNIHSLISGDHKRQHHNRSSPASLNNSDEPSASSRTHYSVLQNLSDQLPHRVSERVSELDSQPLSLLSPSNVGRPSMLTQPHASPRSTELAETVHRQLIDDISKHSPTELHKNTFGSLAVMVARDVSLGTLVVPGEANNGTVCAIRNNNNNNNVNHSGEVNNHHERSSIKTFEMALSTVSASSGPATLGTLPQESLVSNTPAIANSAVQ